MSDFAGDVPDRGTASDAPLVRVLKIVNKKGLHARPAAKFVQIVERYDAQVRVVGKHETVDGASILDLLTLSASPGTSITVEATGHEAAAVLDALEKFVASGFGEED
jgi:phosphocarrier protein HPr